MSKTSFKMRRLMAGLAFAASAAFLFNPSAPAQNGPGGPGGPPPPAMVGHWRGRGGPGPGGFGHGGTAKVVTGEPYSGQAVTSMTETLPDGSHIARQITASIARDSEGRTMRSESFNGFGIAGSIPTGATITTIFDPVANQRIELNAKSKTARIFILPAPPADSEAGSHPGRGSEQHRNRFNSSKVSVQTESLSPQMIGGVSAQGTQTTRTIAAGAIGNDQPLVSTEERWYSPDLQIVLQSTQTDPRFGQTTYVINNFQRGEPSASLFQVPAGYQSKTIEPPAPRPAP